MQNRLIFNLFKKDNYTGEEIAKDANLKKQLEEKEAILNTPKVYKTIGENCVCTGVRDQFTVTAQGYLFNPDGFASNNSNLHFRFDEVNQMDLTINVFCSKDKKKMLEIYDEFQRAVNHLSDDFGRFHLTLSNLCQIVRNFEDHLKRNGFAVNTHQNQYQTEFRPSGNTAF